MELGMIGLGKMGSFMSERLVRAGHAVVGFDLDPEAVSRVEGVGAGGAGSIEDLVERLAPRRAVWMMVPSGRPVDDTLDLLLPHLDRGDLVIDGGNSHYKDTLRRSDRCRQLGVHLVDVGTSGGIWGLREGYSLMVGGEDEPVEHLTPILQALAPSPEQGWGHVGPAGSGHFVKMVHNGIEYGLMQAYAEGFALLGAKEEFGLDLEQVAGIWSNGSVIRSWLLDLVAKALSENPSLAGIAPYVPDSGEGRWTVFEAIDLDVPAPVITLALMRRIGSRDEMEFADRLVAALRHQFGGHAVKLEG